MNNTLISVIMSTYNESEEELRSSIYSVLKQTYSNLEFIIINDNPQNNMLSEILCSIKDDRVRIFNNSENFGLVYSLNRAWKLANGDMIARMDADDICLQTRLEKQFNFIQKYNYDLIGCDIKVIDELGNVIHNGMHFPTSEKGIKKNIYWNNCIAHPTWMIKKSLYEKLGGYRDILYCEDYDFILRTIKSGYKVGNMPDIGLIYRIRSNSISNSNRYDQYLLSNYLSYKKEKILELTEEQVRSYCMSKKFKDKRKSYISYCENKRMIKENKRNWKNIIRMLVSPYLYRNLLEKYMWIKREKL